MRPSALILILLVLLAVLGWHPDPKHKHDKTAGPPIAVSVAGQR